MTSNMECSVYFFNSIVSITLGGYCSDIDPLDKTNMYREDIY